MTAKAILFTSPTCGPCKAMKPIVMAVAEQAGIPIEVTEVGAKSPEVASFSIRAVPTLVLIDSTDKETKRLVGAQSSSSIEQFFA